MDSWLNNPIWITGGTIFTSKDAQFQRLCMPTIKTDPKVERIVQQVEAKIATDLQAQKRAQGNADLQTVLQYAPAWLPRQIMAEDSAVSRRVVERTLYMVHPTASTFHAQA